MTLALAPLLPSTASAAPLPPAPAVDPLAAWVPVETGPEHRLAVTEVGYSFLLQFDAVCRAAADFPEAERARVTDRLSVYSLEVEHWRVVERYGDELGEAIVRDAPRLMAWAHQQAAAGTLAV
jgi:hypothetical protein